MYERMISISTEEEGRIVWGMLIYERGEGVGFYNALKLFIKKDKLRELGNIAYNLDEVWSDNILPKTEDQFILWFEFEKSLIDSKYFKK